MQAQIAIGCDSCCALDIANHLMHRGREALADLFIVLRRGMTKEGAGLQVVQAELDCFIELLFKDSEAYWLALKLYAGRYEVIAARDAADILREVIEKQMHGNDEQTPKE